MCNRLDFSAGAGRSKRLPQQRNELPSRARAQVLIRREHGHMAQMNCYVGRRTVVMRLMIWSSLPFVLSVVVHVQRMWAFGGGWSEQRISPEYAGSLGLALPGVSAPVHAQLQHMADEGWLPVTTPEQRAYSKPKGYRI